MDAGRAGEILNAPKAQEGPHKCKKDKVPIEKCFGACYGNTQLNRLKQKSPFGEVSASYCFNGAFSHSTYHGSAYMIKRIISNHAFLG